VRQHVILAAHPQSLHVAILAAVQPLQRVSVLVRASVTTARIRRISVLASRESEVVVVAAAGKSPAVDAMIDWDGVGPEGISTAQ